MVGPSFHTIGSVLAAKAGPTGAGGPGILGLRRGVFFSRPAIKQVWCVAYSPPSYSYPWPSPIFSGQPTNKSEASYLGRPKFCVSAHARALDVIAMVVRLRPVWVLWRSSHRDLTLKPFRGEKVQAASNPLIVGTSKTLSSQSILKIRSFHPRGPDSSSKRSPCGYSKQLSLAPWNKIVTYASESKILEEEDTADQRSP